MTTVKKMLEKTQECKGLDLTKNEEYRTLIRTRQKIKHAKSEIEKAEKSLNAMIKCEGLRRKLLEGGGEKFDIKVGEYQLNITERSRENVSIAKIRDNEEIYQELIEMGAITTTDYVDLRVKAV